jgi:cytochrome P450
MFGPQLSLMSPPITMVPLAAPQTGDADVTNICPLRMDERGIPVLDPELLPDKVAADVDWRSTADEIREQFPFFRLGDDPTIWFSRYDTVRRLYEDHELFSNRKTYDFPFLLPLDEDPPRHTALRRALMPMYSQGYVTRWEPRIRERVQELIGAFAQCGEADFMAEFAQLLFPWIAAEWMGVPDEDRARLVGWNHDVFLMPDESQAAVGVQMTNNTMQLISDYVTELVELRRAEPGDDFTSFVLGIEIDGEPLSEREIHACVAMACIGSGDTVTSHLGYVFKHLAEHPEHRHALADDPDAIDRAGEELHRIYPLYGIPRAVTHDADFDGCPLRAGDRVFALYSMANRDPRHQGFEELDLGRRSNPHLGFQVGVHRCIGLHWAKLTRRVAIEEWHRAIPDYAIREGATFTEQIHSGVGFHTLPLVWPVGAG